MSSEDPHDLVVCRLCGEAKPTVHHNHLKDKHQLTIAQYKALFPDAPLKSQAANECIRSHKFNFRHKHLKNKLDIYDPLLSESENCERNNIHEIYNCGLLRFTWHNSNTINQEISK